MMLVRFPLDLPPPKVAPKESRTKTALWTILLVVILGFLTFIFGPALEAAMNG